MKKPGGDSSNRSGHYNFNYCGRKENHLSYGRGAGEASKFGTTGSVHLSLPSGMAYWASRSLNETSTSL